MRVGPRRAISLRASDFDTTAPFTPAMRRGARATVLEMFHHGYDNYVEHAFPHDELRPMTATHTDSLGELGNLNKEHLSETYEGVALTLIDATSTLAVLGNATEFAKNVRWLSSNLDFDQDVRVNAFECNIRAGRFSLRARPRARRRGRSRRSLDGRWFRSRVRRRVTSDRARPRRTAPRARSTPRRACRTRG